MKRLFCLFMALSIILMLPLSSFASPVNEPYYNEYGYLTYQMDNFSTDYNYSARLGFNPPLVHGSSTEIPSGYVQVAYAIYSSSQANDIYSIYGSPSGDYTLSFGSTFCYFGSPVTSSLYVIENRVDSNGNLSFRSSSSRSRVGGGYFRISCLVPVSVNGNVILPENQVDFHMNIAIIGYNLSVNSQINSGSASHVDYYIFPSTTSIPSGSTTTIVPFTSASELTQSQEENFFIRGFKWIGEKINDLITDISSPKVSLSSSSSVRSSSIFNPSSYGVAYEKIGSGVLFPSSGVSLTPTATLSLKDMISSHTGVYSSSSLKLVAVVNTENTSFVATFDFAPASIVGGSPVPPSTLQGQVPYPDFNKPDSDFKDLADYLKNLMQANNDNAIRNNSNLLAMLNSIPWTNFVTGGFVNGLPNLSFMLDSLFDSLFDKFTAPTQEQIDAILADINTERTSLRAKLAFVDDVKTEYYFVISTITADNNSVPPDFEFSLPSIWSGGQNIRVKLISYEIATPEIMANIKQVITVFLSLALLLHIWRTLPATVGNMPRGDG